MDQWDRNAIDLLGPALIQIGADGAGSFRFIAVEADFDGRHVERDGNPAVEFSWVGTDDNDDASGRGWALLEADGSLIGHIYLHRGDESSFRATRQVAEWPAGHRLATVRNAGSTASAHWCRVVWSTAIPIVVQRDLTEHSIGTPLKPVLVRAARWGVVDQRYD